MLRHNPPCSTGLVINAGAGLFHFSKCFLLRFLCLPLSRFELRPIHFLNVRDTGNTKGREMKSGLDVQLKGEGPSEGVVSLAELQAGADAGLTTFLGEPGPFIPAKGSE